MVNHKINETKHKNETIKGIIMNKQLDEILQKRMDRKDFLKHLGMGVAVITGTAGIVKMFKPQSSSLSQTNQKTVGMGYGASVYGGRAATTSAAKS